MLVGFGVLWFGTVMFALFGKFCHPPDCDESEYFGSLWLSVLSSFTILTTANYPDVMLPAYGYNRLFGMPFVLFAAFGPSANTHSSFVMSLLCLWALRVSQIFSVRVSPRLSFCHCLPGFVNSENAVT